MLVDLDHLDVHRAGDERLRREREVEDTGRLVSEDDPDRDERVDATEGNPLDEPAHERIHEVLGPSSSVGRALASGVTASPGPWSGPWPSLAAPRRASPAGSTPTRNPASPATGCSCCRRTAGPACRTSARTCR